MPHIATATASARSRASRRRTGGARDANRHIAVKAENSRTWMVTVMTIEEAEDETCRCVRFLCHTSVTQSFKKVCGNR